MTAKKPKGWYGKAAKADRREKRARRARLEQVHRAKKGLGPRSAPSPEDRAAAAERSAIAIAKAKAEADEIGARVEAKAANGREARARSVKEYDRQARALRRDLQPKLSGVDRGTPHTRRQHRKTSFERLCDERAVTGDMAQAAQEIERVYLAICGAVVIGGLGLERGGGGGSAGPISDGVAMAHASRYKPWADEMARMRKGGDWPFLEIVIDVVVDGRTFRDVETEKRMRNGAARHALCWALLKYGVMARWCDVSVLREYEDRYDVHRRALKAA
ncbi:hypothetical protein [Chenggangzhangella methanolivorans]|uniref:Uncharacterized protein n=2 Tax=Chenggangzhangella methanolivorans TaxID=1437009 RepID=A0A9E6REL0_9HYPH|nr:hypothetical protein [Chenggangzhangella methanolivorans]QZN99780.1 hypothetical protein K6K41_24475 [Chenggangzhangella methanolivorans]